jgi:Glycosyl hydrolase family 9.
MTKIINITVWSIVITLMSSCKPNTVMEGESLPAMPMKAVYENSLEYLWSQKQVVESKLLSDMEMMGTWEHGGFGTLTLSDEKPYEGKYSLLIESPTKGPEPPRGGRPWGVSKAIYKVNDEDWTDWNRISFWIYPDLPGFKVVSINTIFFNDGEEKVPDSYDRNGVNYRVLENQKWNKVYWEIAHLGRDKVKGIEINYRVQGNEPGATETARFFIDEIYLEKVNTDHFEGWNIQPGGIAYNHAGYTTGYPKVAFTSDKIEGKYFLKDHTSGKIVKEGVVNTKIEPVGTFRIMDFSDVNTEGVYILEAGGLKTKPFIIGTFSDVFRSSIIKTVNHFYTQRCGFAIPGIHDICHLDWLCTHEDLSIPIHGGWHDAGDLTQALARTAESAYSMMMLAEKLKKTDCILSDRLLEEAEWGVSWMLRTRFGDGFRMYDAIKDMWTDGIHGTKDDWNARARKDPHANLISSLTETFAAKAFKDRNPFLSAQALKCGIEDYRFGLEIEPRRMNVDMAGAALNAALALYEITKDETYKISAIEHANYILSCQQQENPETDIPLKGFFYRTPDKETIVHYPHISFEQNLVVGLVKMSQMFPSESAEWKKALRLYADYYKEICSYTAPYYMIPAGIYDVTKARNEVDAEQIRRGIKMNEKYYMKRFPVWGEARGNSGTTLSQAKGLAVIANFLQDKELFHIVYRALDWHLGANPFTQSLMYGEGYRFTGQYSVTSGDLVGGLPVGIQTHFNNDEPFWSAENCYNWKEIWVFPSLRWLMLVSDFV